MKPGVELLSDDPGEGPLVERQLVYSVRLKIWLHKGDPVIWPRPWGPIDRAYLEDGGATLFTDLRVDRESMFGGLFYGVHGMRVGGTRKLRIAPHLAYGERGVPGTIPANALLTVEIKIIKPRTD